MLMGALLFGRKIPKLAWAGVAGGLIPDVPMIAIVGYLRATGHEFQEIFGKLYWEHWWQVANAIGHNFLLWFIVCTLGFWMTKSQVPTQVERGKLAFALSASAIVHSFVDLLCHRNDGHMHFWPLTEWRFVSPISYWDNAHYGTQFGLFEATLGLAMALILYRTFKHWAVRTALAIAAILYAAIPAFFIYNLGGA
jgi:hypothetical protein